MVEHPSDAEVELEEQAASCLVVVCLGRFCQFWVVLVGQIFADRRSCP